MCRVKKEVLFLHVFFFQLKNTICCKCNCLANLGLEKDNLCVTTQQERYSSRRLTQESQVKMNDLDNATGLPATRRQFLVTTERRGDEKILGRLIENTLSSKSKRSDWGMPRAHRDMHQQHRSGKSNFLSIFYQNLIQHWRPGICTWHLFKLGLLCFLTMLAFEPGHSNARKKR